MKKDGFAELLDFLDFLDFLREKDIEFDIVQEAPTSLTVKFGLVGVRVEAD